MQRQLQIDYLSEMPQDILLEILKKTVNPVENGVKLSQTCVTLFSALSGVSYWKNRLIEKGLLPDLFARIEGRMQEYPKFYRSYLRIAANKPTTLCKLIELLIDDFWQYCEKQKTKGYGYGLIDDIFQRRVSKISPTCFEKQILDVIARLFEVDREQGLAAYDALNLKYRVSAFGIH